MPEVAPKMRRRPTPRKGKMVEIKMLKSMASMSRGVLRPGQKATYPKIEAENLVARGVAEYWTEVDLKDAVCAVQENGGEISFEKDNAVFIKIFKELEADKKAEKKKAAVKKD